MATASGIDRCSGWGRVNSADNTSTSRSRSKAAVADGTSFTSVTYATGPMR